MFCGDFVGCECFQNKVLVYEKVAGEVRRPPATFENPEADWPPIIWLRKKKDFYAYL